MTQGKAKANRRLHLFDKNGLIISLIDLWRTNWKLNNGNYPMICLWVTKVLVSQTCTSFFFLLRLYVDQLFADGFIKGKENGMKSFVTSLSFSFPSTNTWSKHNLNGKIIETSYILWVLVSKPCSFGSEAVGDFVNAVSSTNRIMLVRSLKWIVRINLLPQLHQSSKVTHQGIQKCNCTSKPLVLKKVQTFNHVKRKPTNKFVTTIGGLCW